MFKKFLKYSFFIIVCIFALSCTQEGEHPRDTSKNKVSYTANIQAEAFAPGELEAHYKKHAIEFGIITQQEYLDAARSLLNAVQGRDVLQKKRTNGDILRYRVSTREFAVMTAKGRIRTYFKADYNYWMGQ